LRRLWANQTVEANAENPVHSAVPLHGKTCDADLGAAIIALAVGWPGLRSLPWAMQERICLCIRGMPPVDWWRPALKPLAMQRRAAATAL